MSVVPALPQAIAPFIQFAAALRGNGFAVTPEQTQSFIAAVGLLGPKGIRDIYLSALATLAPPIDRRAEFEALFRMVFLGHSQPVEADAGDDDEVAAYDDRDGAMDPPEAEEAEESGAEASFGEVLAIRNFRGSDETAALLRLRREAAERLPRRKSRRLRARRAGRMPDLRRALREAVKRDGEVLRLPMLDRRERQRRLLLLIDISGSMKAQTEGHLRFAHALMQSAETLEVFTLGTRLTRVTRALKLRNRAQALAVASTIVADWDGGTRLGDALHAFLGVPRFAGFARSAMVVVLSDGLERGDPAVLVASVQRLSRLAWSLLWLTPLAVGSTYQPQTEAMLGIEKFVDRFGSGADVGHLCREVLDHARRAA
jgi:uncharacterized protein